MDSRSARLPVPALGVRWWVRERPRGYTLRGGGSRRYLRKFEASHVATLEQTNESSSQHSPRMTSTTPSETPECVVSRDAPACHRAGPGLLLPRGRDYDSSVESDRFTQLHRLAIRPETGSSFMSSVTVTSNQALHYEDDYFGEPWKIPETVLLIHGAAESSKAWFAWVPHLARTFRVLRPDQRGFGQSKLSSETFG